MGRRKKIKDEAEVAGVAEVGKVGKVTMTPRFRVAKGKSLCCRNQVLEHPAEVKPEWLGGSTNALARLIERGYVEVVDN